MSRKFISFEDVEQLADIQQLAQMLNLNTKPSGQQLRCACPIHGGDERTLCISPMVRSRKGSLGVFFCQKDQTGGDRIGLVAHCMGIGQQDAAFFIAEQFGTGTVETGTVTVSKTRATAPPEASRVETTAPAFDAEKFASKLIYSDEVGALGLSEQDATHLGIGWHPVRKKVYFPLRNRDGSIAGFTSFANGELQMPPRWLFTNITPLRRKA